MTLNLEALIQPDGTIVLPQVGSVVAAGKSIDVLRAELDERFRAFMKEPAIVIAPVSVNKTLEELRAAIVNRQGVFAGQSFHAKVSPNGMVQLPAIGSVPVQGLSLTELRNEVEYRYAEMVDGIEVTPVLSDRAPCAVYVLGEVAKPGRFALEAPTTVIQAIAMAGSWNIGGNVKEVIVFRRDEQWRLMATRVNVKPALYNYRCLDGDDIWLRDSDIVIVPKCPIQVLDDVIQLVFTKGIYGVLPSHVLLDCSDPLKSIGRDRHRRSMSRGLVFMTVRLHLGPGQARSAAIAGTIRRRLPRRCVHLSPRPLVNRDLLRGQWDVCEVSVFIAELGNRYKLRICGIILDF